MSNNDNYSNKVTNDKNDIENVVSESERVMGCKGVETKVYQLERVYEEGLGEYGGKGQIFPVV